MVRRDRFKKAAKKVIKVERLQNGIAAAAQEPCARLRDEMQRHCALDTCRAQAGAAMGHGQTHVDHPHHDTH